MEKFEIAIGKPVPQASAEITKLGYKMNVIKKDGKNLTPFEAYEKERINVEVVLGIVVKILSIG